MLRGARSTWRLLETPAWFDAIFAHRFQAYVAARYAHREEMRSDFMTACELDGSEFYPLLHSAFQFRALVVDEDGMGHADSVGKLNANQAWVPTDCFVQVRPSPSPPSG